MKIIRGKYNFDLKSFLFPGGEVGFRINTGKTAFSAKTCEFGEADSQIIIQRIQKSDDFFELAMAVDALRRIDKTPIKLFLPYIPYGRQDRVCNKGESFSLKVFADLLNSLRFEEVITADPHSHVTEALINNIKVYTQFDIINRWLEFSKTASNCILVSPDAGANKKTFEIAKYFQANNFVRADKLRDLATGDIKETIVYYDDFKGEDVLVLDDLIDGGKTFIELSKVCKSKNCGKFILYATHSILSKGAKILFEGGIDEIWTTNSFNYTKLPDEDEYYNRLKIFNLE